MPVAVYVCDRSGIIQSYNKRAAELWGREPKLGDAAQCYCGSLRLYSPNGKVMPHAESPMAEALKTGVEARDLEVVIERPDGSRITALANIALLRNAEGELIGAMNCFQDISERKQAEDALRQSEERFAAFMDNLPGYAWMKDLQGRYVYVNEMVKGLPGYRSLGKTDAQIWPADLAAEYRANDEQVIAAKKPLNTLEHYQLKGKQRYMAGSKFPILDKTGAVALVGGAGVDITERIEAEEALQAAHQQLRVLSRRRVQIQEEERRHLARELHDEIGQALTAAKINLQAAMKEPDGPKSKRIHETAAILERLLGQVRQISIDLRPSMLDDLGLVPALRSLLNEQGRRASIAVRFSAKNMPESLGPEIQTTCFRIAQEAITNAVRHANATRIDVDLGRENGNLRLQVRDNGRGFDAESAQAQTTGLGLIGIKERAALVDARAKIISSPKKGTTVEVSLSLTDSPERAIREIRK